MLNVRLCLWTLITTGIARMQAVALGFQNLKGRSHIIAAAPVALTAILSTERSYETTAKLK